MNEKYDVPSGQTLNSNDWEETMKDAQQTSKNNKSGLGATQQESFPKLGELSADEAKYTGAQPDVDQARDKYIASRQVGYIEDPEKAFLMAETEDSYRQRIIDARNAFSCFILHQPRKKQPNELLTTTWRRDREYKRSAKRGMELLGHYFHVYSLGSERALPWIEHDEAEAAREKTRDIGDLYDIIKRQLATPQSSTSENPEAERIQDPEKARAMAEAEDPYRQQVIDVRNAITDAFILDSPDSLHPRKRQDFKSRKSYEEYKESVKRGRQLIRDYKIDAGILDSYGGWIMQLTPAEYTIKRSLHKSEEAAEQAKAQYEADHPDDSEQSE